MNSENYAGADKVPRLIHANTSPRYRRLEWLESWVAGSQYDDRACGWFDDAAPLWERKPCIVYPAVEIAIDSYVDLIFGESRFPAFTSSQDEQDADDEALSEDEAKALDRFIAKEHAECRFRAYCREGLTAAMGCGTSVGIHGHREGKPFAELIPAKWCTPKLKHDGAVISLEIRYPYVEEYKQPGGTWAVRVMLYRRTIDAEKDTTFFPAEARDDGQEPAWQADPAQTFLHGLGFCPVIWYPFMRGCAPVNVIDGTPIHERTTDEIEQHDIARSQWHRCSLFSEPQICETGVQPGHNPTGTGRTPVIPGTEHGGKLSVSNPQTSGYQLGGTPDVARKKGPGHVWQYPDPNTKVTALTIGADALKAQHTNVSDLRLKVQEALGVVFLDPENIKFAATTSGKALQAIKQKQIDRCGTYRDDVAERFLRPSIDMQLRIAAKVGEQLRVPSIKKALPVLRKFETADVVAAA